MTAVPLTAQTVAHAVVAAAHAHGDHPLRALESRAGKLRRSLKAASRALELETGETPARICAVLDMSVAAHVQGIRENRPDYLAAVRAARRALAPFAPVAPEPPVAPAAPIDHRPAIREAVARFKGRVAAAVVPHGERPTPDKGCLWPVAVGESCGAARVEGRQYCPEHCKAAGLKPTPRPLRVEGRVARPYSSRDLDASGQP